MYLFGSTYSIASRRFAILLLCFFSLSIKAQEQTYSDLLAGYEPPKLNVLKSSPLAAIISQIPITAELRAMYERVLSPKQSTVVGISYLYPNFFFRDTLAKWNDSLGVNFKLNGLRLQAHQRFYLLRYHDAPSGIFVGPQASYSMVKLNNKGKRDDFVKVVYLNVNLIGGYQVVIGRFVFEAYTGIGYRDNYLVLGEYGQPDRTVEELNRGFKFTLATNIGFTF